MPAEVSHLHGTAGAAGAYTGMEIKEGVVELIYQIVPEDTPGLVMFGRGNATHVRHEWLFRRRGGRTGTSGQHRAVPPGDQFQLATVGSGTTGGDDFDDLAVPTRDINYCEIFRVLPRVDETTLAVNMYGVTDIMADQVEFRAVDFAIYIEERLWNGTQNAGPTSGTDTTAWQMGGLVSEITDNVLTVDQLITDNHLQNIFNQCWADGGRPQDLFCGPNVKSAMIDALGGNFQKFIDQNERGIVNTLSFYEGATQTISIHLTRDLEDATISTTGATSVFNRAMLIDRSAVRLMWLREPFIERLPRMAGDERVRIEGQVTVEFGDERAHGELNDIAIPAAITA